MVFDQEHNPHGDGGGDDHNADNGADDGVLQSVSAGGTGTDANAMQLNRAGMATGLLGVPLRYMHTPVELLSLKDVEDCARLMAAYCRQVKADTDFSPR